MAVQRSFPDLYPSPIHKTVPSRNNLWNRFCQNRLALISLYILFLIILVSFLGPLFLKYSYSAQFLDKQGLKPNPEFWFGTDSLGRDVFVRTLYGARISLTVGFVAALINLTVGILYGAVSGYRGGLWDNFLMRIVDIFYSIPLILYVIVLMVFLGPGLFTIFLTLGFIYWMDMARIVRAQILSLKEQEFVLAAKALGASSPRILFFHLLPNSLGPIIGVITLSISQAIFTEAFLSFLGLGVSAPMASLGTLVSDGLSGIRSYPHVIIFPSLTISIIILTLHFIGDGLRDAFDPRMNKEGGLHG